MNLKLVKLDKTYKKQFDDMLEEWTNYNNTHDDNKSPSAIFKNDYRNFDYYLENLEIKNPPTGKVPDSVLFCLDQERNIFVGAVNIRHYLNEFLLLKAGHIGDGIRPSERKKGYGTKMISLALEKCKELGIDRVLMTCNKENIASAKTIINNGGVLENEIEHEGEIFQRYWIDNK